MSTGACGGLMLIFCVNCEQLILQEASLLRICFAQNRVWNWLLYFHCFVYSWRWLAAGKPLNWLWVSRARKGESFIVLIQFVTLAFPQKLLTTSDLPILREQLQIKTPSIVFVKSCCTWLFSSIFVSVYVFDFHNNASWDLSIDIHFVLYSCWSIARLGSVAFWNNCNGFTLAIKKQRMNKRSQTWSNFVM